MAIIVFYESTPTDNIQLSAHLKPTDHYWEFKRGAITPENINPDTEVISVFVGSVVTREIMDKMPRLKLIATRSTGYDHIDLDHAKMRGISVVNVPTYGENTVAEHAFALLLAVTKKLVPTISLTKKGIYKAEDLMGFDLSGKTMGIIGTGHIGRYTAKIARGFGMNVIAYDKYQDTDIAKEIGFTYENFDEVLARSDVISLHIPMTPGAYHMINMGTIERMKHGAILINTSRGELVENRAIIAALNSGRLGGAGLDTLEGEKFLRLESVIKNLIQKAASPQAYLNTAEASAMLRMPNVVVTPHSAYNTTEAIERINRTTAENIIKFWYGESPNLVRATQSSGKLVIIRHGQSEWNEQGRWTGTTDVHITEKGRESSMELGEKLADTKFDFAYISQQVRTRETLDAIMQGASQPDLKFEQTAAINERDYGIYTGMKKEAIEKIIGPAAYNELRRSWDSPVESGESLKDVYERVIPFYLRIILPRLRHGQNILVVAHGNSIRSLIKYIDNISDDQIGETEMLAGQALVYEVDSEGRSKKREIIEWREPLSDELH